ncbi:MAG: DUF305 domain-containing protein [Actinomycetota bacterium]|nr:DUF305 domain-containing protein [Actinomycetota bacterium]
MLLAACGSSSNKTGSSSMPGMSMGSTSTGQGTTAASGHANAVDRAFVQQMIPHHQMAVQMAQTAKTQGQHPQITTLAGNIITAQDREISEMTPIASKLGVKPDAMPMNGSMSGHMMSADQALGLTMAQSGMTMNMSALNGAKPFDRAFIDMMIPHHQGAIRMARAELARGTNPQLKTIAQGIIADQTKEIGEMNTWRSGWYGAASPAGGVPTA